MDVKNMVARIRKQCQGFYLDLLDFIELEGDEIVFSQQMKKDLQYGREKEFSLPVEVFFKRGREINDESILTVKYGAALLFEAIIDPELGTDTTYLRVQSCIEFIPYAKERAIESIVKYFPYSVEGVTINEPKMRSEFSQKDPDDIDSMLKMYRKIYVNHMADILLDMARKYPLVCRTLDGVGLLTKESFHERNLPYIEKLYVDLVAQVP